MDMFALPRASLGKSRSFRTGVLLAGAGVALSGSGAFGQLALIGQFQSGVAAVGAGYDHRTESVWIYAEFGAELRRYSPTGMFLGSIPRPGGSANDADIDFAPEQLTMGSTVVPAGSLLFIDGESGTAEIYAVDPATGAVLATLSTSFGVSHVVGGAYHPQRDTFFLVQDRVPGAADENRIAEVNAVTGAVMNALRVTDALPTFTVNFGDLAVGNNGNLIDVSSDETTIAELTPAGAFVQELTLPKGVGNLCGVGFDPTRSELWVAANGNNVWRLSLSADCSADFNSDGVVNSQDFFDFLTAFFDTLNTADFNGDAVVNSQDFFDFLTTFFQGCP